MGGLGGFLLGSIPFGMVGGVEVGILDQFLTNIIEPVYCVQGAIQPIIVFIFDRTKTPTVEFGFGVLDGLFESGAFFKRLEEDAVVVENKLRCSVDPNAVEHHIGEDFV